MIAGGRCGAHVEDMVPGRGQSSGRQSGATGALGCGSERTGMRLLVPSVLPTSSPEQVLNQDLSDESQNKPD